MERKNYHGTIKDKEKTKLKLLNAVGLIIRTEGYTQLKVNKIGRVAGVDKKLIYTYFTSLENLVETYIKQKDYWISFFGNVNDSLNKSVNPNSKEFAQSILTGQLDFFSKDKEMQEIVRWELLETSKIMREVCVTREKLGEDLFQLTDETFKDSNIDLRAISALMVAGIYYLVLHNNSNNSLFCEIDIKDSVGFSRINNAINWVISQAYDEAAKQKADVI